MEKNTMLVDENYQVLNYLKASLAVTERDSTIVFVNQAWESFAQANGQTAEHFVGSRYLTVCEVADGTELSDAIQFAQGFRKVADGTVPSFETIYPCHSRQQKRWFKSTIQPFGERILITHTDVSQAILGTAPIAARGDLIHDLKSPLNAILGYTEMIKCADRESLSNEKMVEVLSTIGIAGERLLALVNTLLDEVGNHQLNETLVEEWVDARALINEVVDQNIPRSQLQKVDIAARTIGGLAISADRNMIWRLLTNLVSNAIKYNRAGGRVIVSMDINNSGGLEFIVHDTGIGISRESQADIFDTYQRDAGLGVPDQVEGSGLGLTIVKELADLHDAKIRISSAVDVGTSITIVFPTWRTKRFSTPDQDEHLFGQCDTCQVGCTY